MNNKLIIAQRIVELHSSVAFSALQIECGKEVYIDNLLQQQDYIVMKNSKKIIIINLKGDPIDKLELFSYDGYCEVKKAFIIDKNYKRYDLYLHFTGNQSWDNLGKWDELDANSNKYLWESLTSDYRFMLHNGRNDNVPVKTSINIYNPDTKKYTTEDSYIVKPGSMKYKRDKNLTTKNTFDDSYFKKKPPKRKFEDRKISTKVSTRKVRSGY